MKLTSKQTTQITDEIAVLQGLSVDDLNEDQLQGHYERVIELADQTVASKKELSQALHKLATSFNPKGEELAGLQTSIDNLKDAAEETVDAAKDEAESSSSEEASSDAPNELFRPLANLRKALKKDQKVKVVTDRVLLRAALKENGVKFAANDNVAKLTERLDYWLKGEPNEPTPAPEPEKPKAVNLNHAKGLATSLAAYVTAYAVQQRATGRDTARYHRFVRDLEQITRQRLI